MCEATLVKKLDCCCCDNDISVSQVRFEATFKDGDKQIYCVYHLTEMIGEVPEDVQSVKNVGEFKLSEKSMEMDVWINHGCKGAFRDHLVSDNDIKHLEFNEISRDSEGIRYAITCIAFSDLKTPKGPWQVKDIYEVN